MNDKKYQKERDLFERLSHIERLESEVYIYNMRIISKEDLK